MGRGGNFSESVAALESARASGIRYFRFFASDWGPNKAFWAQHQAQYWSEFDRLWDEIDRVGLSAIPSLGTDSWNAVANTVTPGLAEDANAPVVNSTSVSRRLALEYFAQFVTRYRNRSSLLLWELGNELNLQVNLPPPHCGASQCFNTSQMVSFTGVLADQIRKLDHRRRPISSGFSIPRPSAWHQEHCPFAGTCDGLVSTNSRGTALRHELERRCSSNLALPCPADPGSSGYWGIDTREQWLSMLARQQQAVSIWSIHIYDKTEECFFDPHNCTVPSAALVADCANAASAAGAMLFVGEFGGPTPNYTGPSVASQAFPGAVLQAQVADAHAHGAFGLSAIWAWQCPTHRCDMNCIWPNSTRPTEAGSDRMLRLLQEADEAMHR